MLHLLILLRYGDNFISGREEGGELNAVTSMKVSEESKTFEIKTSRETSGSVKSAFQTIKNDISKITETTVAVDWFGGGAIIDSGEAWKIASTQKAAAAFLDLVAMCPQRISQSLPSMLSSKAFSA
ncbi:hypothetical protein LTS08_007778 [Lithohypha guttulata]|nr:hypothetical protein LTS08_007778 [Lithohypha guttulata]